VSKTGTSQRNPIAKVARNPRSPMKVSSTALLSRGRRWGLRRDLRNRGRLAPFCRFIQLSARSSTAESKRSISVPIPQWLLESLIVSQELDTDLDTNGAANEKLTRGRQVALEESLSPWEGREKRGMGHTCEGKDLSRAGQRVNPECQDSSVPQCQRCTTERFRDGGATTLKE
jgi:hypothetical protein